MRIAIMVWSLYGGGAEKCAQMIGDYYSELGHEVVFFVEDVNLKPDYQTKGKVVNTGIQAESYDIGNINKLLKAASIIRRMKRRYKIDVAISFMEDMNVLNILSFIGEKRILSVHTVLSLRTDEYQGLNYQKKWISLLYARADAVVAVGDGIKRDLQMNYGIKRKLFKIPNFVLIENDSDEKEWIYGEKTIIHVGSLREVKQQDRIIRAFRCVYEKCPDAKLIILGRGKLEHYLKKLSKHLGLDESVVFPGFVGDVSHYLIHGRLFVMASKVEGFPNSMLEAMAMGLPVVTTDSPGGCPEILGKEESEDGIQYCRYGLLTPYLSGKPFFSNPIEEGEKLLGKAMLEVLTNDSLYERYHKASLRRAKMFNQQKIMEEWDRLVLG